MTTKDRDQRPIEAPDGAGAGDSVPKLPASRRRRDSVIQEPAGRRMRNSTSARAIACATPGTKAAPPSDRFAKLDLPPLPEGLVIGVQDISLALRGSANQDDIRDIYRMLAGTSTIPGFKWGGRWAVHMPVVRAKFWSQQKRAMTELEEPLVKLHVLLSAMQPLLAGLCNDALDEHQELQLAHAVAEVLANIDQVLAS